VSVDAADLLRQLSEGRMSGDGLNAIVGRMVAHDPMLSQLLQLMQQQQQQQQQQPAQVIDAPPELDELQRRRARGRARLEAMLAEIETLSARVLRVADALGACVCLGEEADCPRCRGRGVPGTFAIDRPLFDRLIQPAVDRLFNPATRSVALKREDKQ
jgi:hypothetical protein